MSACVFDRADRCSIGYAAEPSSGAQKTVKDYGAVGNGTTDDAPAIQAALDKEEFVFLPAGTYRLGSRLTLARSGMSFVGADPAVTAVLFHARMMESGHGR